MKPGPVRQALIGGMGGPGGARPATQNAVLRITTFVLGMLDSKTRLTSEIRDWVGADG